MKKIFASIIVASAAVLIVSCGNTPKAKLRNSVDSLSYAYGVRYSVGLNEYLDKQAHIDSIYMSEFYKGVIDGFNAGNNKKRSAYYWGIQIGQAINQKLKETDAQIAAKDSVSFLSRNNFLAGFIDGTKGKQVRLTERQVDSLINFIGKRIAAENLQKEQEKERKVNTDFIASKAKSAGVHKLPSGILYKVLKQGNGQIPSASALVSVKYEGKLANGTVIDSYKNNGGQPVQVRVNSVFPSWTQALTNMPVGSKWQIFIPQELANEEQRNYRLPPYSAMEFTLELVDIVEP